MVGKFTTHPKATPQYLAKKNTHAQIITGGGFLCVVVSDNFDPVGCGGCVSGRDPPKIIVKQRTHIVRTIRSLVVFMKFTRDDILHTNVYILHACVCVCVFYFLGRGPGDNGGVPFGA